MLALGERYEANINIPVATVVLEARELEGLVARLGKKILAASRLDEALIEGLAGRIEALEAAEAAWGMHRTLMLPTGKKQLRTSAEELRSDAVAALRHFVSDNARVQAQLNRIVEGTDLADLIEDLKKLAPLVDTHASKLTRAQLPAKGGASLLAAAKALEAASQEAASARAGSDEARTSLALRNRAYWWLREAIDEIRECGRHAFRKNADQARLFRSSYSRKNNKRVTPPAPDA